MRFHSMQVTILRDLIERGVVAGNNAVTAAKPFIENASDWPETKARMQITSPIVEWLRDVEAMQKEVMGFGPIHPNDGGEPAQ